MVNLPVRFVQVISGGAAMITIQRMCCIVNIEIMFRHPRWRDWLERGFL